MQGMIDMAKSPAEVKKEAADYPSPPTASVPKYPYGLCIRLENDELEKLKLDGDLPERGEIVHLVALARVTATSERDELQADGTTKPYRCVELQITHLAAEDEDDEGERTERMRSALYEDGEED